MKSFVPQLGRLSLESRLIYTRYAPLSENGSYDRSGRLSKAAFIVMLVVEHFSSCTFSLSGTSMKRHSSSLVVRDGVRGGRREKY